jgi:periplasmic protein TonB
MPLALLLSPDDQAVSAITAVLEEMSVKCERPLDGVSAARQLNSNNFDLVLVDCENLPAAKLIFDVCRRGKDGNNPVPIAIVDGRAGLPTAFRLGAELILTKPVAKDQARSTVRTAVSRIRKVEPSNSVNAAAAPVASPEHAEASATGQAEGLLTNYEVSQPAPTASVPAPQAMAASAASAAPAIPAPSAKPASSLVVSALATRPSAAMPEFETATPKEDAPTKEEFKPSVITKFSDDPVLADLERAEQGEKPPAPAPEPQKPIFSAYPEKESKTKGPLVFLLVLVMAGGGLYAAWMYQPGFRALVQPQIDKVLSLIGIAPPQVPASAPAKPAAQPSQPPPAGGEGLPVSSITPAPAPAKATPPAQTAAVESPAPEPAKPMAASTDKSSTAPASASLQNVSETKNIAAAISAVEMPGEKSAIILSSKGAEKRLIHSVPATYPAAARTAGGDGTVVIKAVVDENGNVSDARAVEGNPILATAAMKAVKQWRYRPYLRDGKALPFQTVVLVDFQQP